MAERYRCVLLFGPPGVGKGTQGKVLGCIPGFYHMASGDMFRALDKQSELGTEFVEYSSKGLLVPDELTIRLWKQYMEEQIKADAYNPQRDLLLLDGIPRSVQQVELMDDHLDVLRVIRLTAPEMDSLVKRMVKRAEREGRHDDADENVIRKRFEVYKQETMPLLSIFEPQIVSEVRAVDTPVEVLTNILKVLAPVYKEHFGNPLE